MHCDGLTDPRDLGGSIAGPGGPYDRNGVVIDPTNSVLLGAVDVAIVEPYRAGEKGAPMIALEMSGKINKSTDRARVLFFVDEDGAAAICTELIGVATRAGFGRAFVDRLLARLAEQP